MKKTRTLGLYEQIAIRAMQDALYQRLIDSSWGQHKEVFERPDVQEAEALIMRAIAESYAPLKRRPKDGRASPKP